MNPEEDGEAEEATIGVNNECNKSHLWHVMHNARAIRTYLFVLFISKIFRQRKLVMKVAKTRFKY